MQVTNKIILGTVQFGLKYGINNQLGKPDKENVFKILREAYQDGIRILDTAEVYGDAHDLIGEFHLMHPTSVFEVITKFPHLIMESIGSKLDRYLEQLNVPYLNSLFFHSYDSYKENLVSIDLLNVYKLEGKVKYLGVSVYTNSQIEDVLNDSSIDIIQLPFNVFDNLSKRGEILKKAKKTGKIIHTRSAFLQGLFFIPDNTENDISAALRPQLQFLRQLSKASGIPLQKLALNYCLQQVDIDNVLIGVDSADQLRQNLSYAADRLSDSTLTEINSISVKNVDLLNPSLWNQ